MRKIFVFVAFVVILLCGGYREMAPITRLMGSCVAHYKFNDDADSNDVIDSRGYLGGIAQRNTSVLHVVGKIGGAFTFNGSSDYVDTNNTFSSTFLDSFTISLWCRPDDGQPSGSQILIGHYQIGGVFHSYFWLSIDTAGRLYAFYRDGEGNVVQFTTTNAVFSNGVQSDFTFIGLIVEQISSDVKVSLYINGSFLQSTSSSAAMSTYSNSNNFEIGATTQSNPSGNQYFDGLIDGVMIFNKALSEYEVKAVLFNKGRGVE